MQNMIYDQASYDVLFYDANLDAYRTDRFAGWQNSPATGPRCSTYGTLNYTVLTDATAAPSAPASAEPAASGSSAGAAGPSPSATPAPSSTSSTRTTRR